MMCDEEEWPVKRGKGCYHIIPKGDLIEHTTDSVDCSCGIKGDFAKNVIIHSALDGRKPFDKSGDKALWLVVQGKL